MTARDPLFSLPAELIAEIFFWISPTRKSDGRATEVSKAWHQHIWRAQKTIYSSWRGIVAVLSGGLVFSNARAAIVIINVRHSLTDVAITSSMFPLLQSLCIRVAPTIATKHLERHLKQLHGLVSSLPQTMEQLEIPGQLVPFVPALARLRRLAIRGELHSAPTVERMVALEQLTISGFNGTVRFAPQAFPRLREVSAALLQLPIEDITCCAELARAVPSLEVIHTRKVTAWAVMNAFKELFYDPTRQLPLLKLYGSAQMDDDTRTASVFELALAINDETIFDMLLDIDTPRTWFESTEFSPALLVQAIKTQSDASLEKIIRRVIHLGFTTPSVFGIATGEPSIVLRTACRTLKVATISILLNIPLVCKNLGKGSGEMDMVSECLNSPVAGDIVALHECIRLLLVAGATVTARHIYDAVIHTVGAQTLSLLVDSVEPGLLAGPIFGTDDTFIYHLVNHPSFSKVSVTTLRLLVNAGVDINSTATNCTSALHRVLQRPDIELDIKLSIMVNLMEAGATPQTDVVQTLLEVRQRNMRDQTVNLILRAISLCIRQHGRVLCCPAADGSTILEQAVRHSPFLMLKLIRGGLPLTKEEKELVLEATIDGTSVHDALRHTILDMT